MTKKGIRSCGIEVNIFKKSPTGIESAKVQEIVKKTSRKFGLRKAVVNIEIADDRRIVEVNKRFLKKSSITDVISFDVSDDCETVFDIIVNSELAGRQAELRGHSFEAELMLYILHGLLHQLGFDDMTACRAAKMHRTENEILENFGYGAVYGTYKG